MNKEKLIPRQVDFEGRLQKVKNFEDQFVLPESSVLLTSQPIRISQ